MNLPPNLLTIVVILLAVGFPMAAIFSWIYDLTGQVWYAAVLSGTGDFMTALAYREKITADEPGNYAANNLIEIAAFHGGEYNKVMEPAS